MIYIKHEPLPFPNLSIRAQGSTPECVPQDFLFSLSSRIVFLFLPRICRDRRFPVARVDHHIRIDQQIHRGLHANGFRSQQIG